MEVAKETLAIIERESIRLPLVGRRFTEAVAGCLDGTHFYPPEELERIRHQIIATAGGWTGTIEVANETTLAGVARLLADGEQPVAALNFASAKNPGGGFLNGSQAQEESLARSSALYPSLLRARPFYDRHRASPSLLYSDAMILSPACPVFRDDDGSLVEHPYRVTFITSAAPNAGAAATNRPAEIPLIPEVFRRRSEYVLALAVAAGCPRLVLGAWGCGVFRNDPQTVASAFAEHLQRGGWAYRFERIVFSVWDTSPSRETFSAFRSALAPDG
ncbi:MAG: TIGR02452 family protein [Gemmataceae bacterium]